MPIYNKMKNIPVSFISFSHLNTDLNPQEYFINNNSLQNLNPLPKEKILDIGCRDGFVLEYLKNLGCLVTGLDINPMYVELAREKNLDVLLMDVDDMFFDKEFDAVLSLANLHWMRNPNAVLEAVNRALKVKGKFVGEVPAFGNLKILLDAFLEIFNDLGIDALYLIPWYFPTVDDLEFRCYKKGFSVKKMDVAIKKVSIGFDLEAFITPFIPIFAEIIENKQFIIDQMISKLKKRLEKDDNGFIIEYVSIEFIAVKESEIV